MPARKRLPLAVHALNAARGFVMGCADLVPGVSGGTMALILGIYERLVTAIGAVTEAPFRRALRSGAWRRAWTAVDGTFLAALAAGILTAALTLSALLHHLLTAYPTQVYATFFGLVFASAFVVGRRVGAWDVALAALFAAGAAGAFVLVGLTPASTPDSPWFLALSGALGVCALVLPGISGAFILVLLGKYHFVIERISSADVVGLAPVIAGGIVGLLAFARLLAWLLRSYYRPTLAVLAGFLLGSLRKVWPWQEEVSALAAQPLPPPSPAAALAALLLALAGAAAVVALDRSSDRPRKSRSQGA